MYVCIDYPTTLRTGIYALLSLQCITLCFLFHSRPSIHTHMHTSSTHHNHPTASHFPRIGRCEPQKKATEQWRWKEQKIQGLQILIIYSCMSVCQSGGFYRFWVLGLEARLEVRVFVYYTFGRCCSSINDFHLLNHDHRKIQIQHV